MKNRIIKKEIKKIELLSSYKVKEFLDDEELLLICEFSRHKTDQILFEKWVKHFKQKDTPFIVIVNRYNIGIYKRDETEFNYMFNRSKTGAKHEKATL